MRFDLPAYDTLTVYQATICVRRSRPDGTPWPVKPGAEKVDGRTAFFKPDFIMEDDDPRYPGEWSFSVMDKDWFRDEPPFADSDDCAPVWFAEGDLTDIKPVMDIREWRSVHA